MQLDPSNTDLIGAKQVEMAADADGDEGEIAILSAASRRPTRTSGSAR